MPYSLKLFMRGLKVKISAITCKQLDVRDLWKESQFQGHGTDMQTLKVLALTLHTF